MIGDLPRPVLTLNDSLRVADANTAADEWWGRGARSLAGQPVADLLPGLDTAGFSRVAANRSALEVREAVLKPSGAA